MDPSSQWASSTNAATGALLRVRRQKVEGRRADCEPILRGRRPEREGPFERGPLWLRDPVDRRECRTEKLEQSRERHVRLGLDPARPEDAHACRRRPLRRIVEQGRLADPDLADEHDHRAAVQAGGGESGLSSCRSRSRPSSIRRLYGGPRDAKLHGQGPPEASPGSSAYLRANPTEGGGMATIEQAPIDMEKLEAFVFRAVDEVGATLNTALVVMGDRLGLYRALAGAGPLTPTELTGRTGTAERYVREWLNAQAAGGYVDYDPDFGRYTLPPTGARADRC